MARQILTEEQIAKRKEYKRQWAKDNAHRRVRQSRTPEQKQHDSVVAKKRRLNLDPEEIARRKVRMKAYEQSNREAINARRRILRAKHSDRYREYNRRSKEKCKEKAKVTAKIWVSANKHKIAATNKRMYECRYRLDHQFSLRLNLRTRIGNALRNAQTKKVFHTVDVLGCDIKFFMEYLEAQFLPGMTWENRVAWHVDHIIPCDSFDLSDPEQQKRCFHYSNCRPMWARDNISKHTKLPPPHQPRLL